MIANIPDTGQEAPEVDAKVETSEQSNESFETQHKRDLQYLKDSFETLFGASVGGTYARNTEEAYSGAAASIYVLISMKNQIGKETPELVKVGWGEFSKETFEGDRYPAFKKFPHDIYCVYQSDSYFASNTLREEMKNNPIKYLSEHSIFAAKEGKVQKSVRENFGDKSLNRDIQAVPYDEMIRTVRNQIINVHTTPEEFAGFLKELPDNSTELAKYVKYLANEVSFISNEDFEAADEKTQKDVRKKYLMYTLWGMGTEGAGIAIGDKVAMESILDLKRKFDFETNSFK